MAQCNVALLGVDLCEDAAGAGSAHGGCDRPKGLEVVPVYRQEVVVWTKTLRKKANGLLLNP